MSGEIWVAIIAGLFGFAGTVITVVWGNKKNETRAQENARMVKKQTDLTLYRIDQLEKKQDKHNSLMERVFNLEKGEAVLEEELEAVRQHIEDLHK